MSDIPKEVWCRPYLSYDYVEDWFDGSWSNINKGGVKYVRSDRIEQLAAINEEMEAKHTELVSAVKDLLHDVKYSLLDEELSDGEGYELWEDVKKFRRVVCAAGLAELKGQDDE